MTDVQAWQLAAMVLTALLCLHIVALLALYSQLVVTKKLLIRTVGRALSALRRRGVSREKAMTAVAPELSAAVRREVERAGLRAVHDDDDEPAAS